MRSLRARLLALWAFSLMECVAARVLLVQISGQSTAAQVGRGEAVAARACDLIRERYAFYATDWRGPVPPLDDPGLRADLQATVSLALARETGVEGGIRQTDAGPLAYAFPTDSGARPQIGLPAAKTANIQAANEQAAREEAAVARSSGAGTHLLLHACPLPGPIEGLTAWTMTRVAAARLIEHSWPGNARELHNAMERVAALVRGPVISAVDLDFLGAPTPMPPKRPIGSPATCPRRWRGWRPR